MIVMTVVMTVLCEITYGVNEWLVMKSRLLGADCDDVSGSCDN